MILAKVFTHEWLMGAMISTILVVGGALVSVLIYIWKDRKKMEEERTAYQKEFNKNIGIEIKSINGFMKNSEIEYVKLDGQIGVLSGTVTELVTLQREMNGKTNKADKRLNDHDTLIALIEDKLPFKGRKAG